MTAAHSEDTDSPAWSEADFKAARPAAEILPDAIAAQLVRTSATPRKGSLANALSAGGPGLAGAFLAPLRFSKAA